MGLLNYQTILSSYDDKLTLMQWLKKVEAALNNAAAVAFNVNKRGDATLTFSIVFEDGSELESGPIVLQQGESVESAAIVGGHLLLTLTNGDVLDAGQILNGDLNVTGNVTATGNISAGGNISATGNVSAARLEATGTGVETDVITASGASLDIFAPVVNLNNGLAAQGSISTEDEIVTPVITSDEAEIEARKPIIELMTGYSFVQKTVNDVTLEYIYAGACKNGNKLTLVTSLYITRTGNNVPNTAEFCNINIPDDIRVKLIPASVGNYLPLICSKVAATKNALDFVDLSFMCIRGTYGVLLFITNGTLNNLALNDKFYIRVEMTFLLSENLAA